MSASRGVVVFAVVALVLSGCAEERRLPADVKSILDQASEIELLSLDPDADGKKAKESFHDYAVHGKTKLTAKADRTKLLTALYKGVADSDGKVAACFIPRHGVRATHGENKIELVICFQCLSGRVYAGKQYGILTTSSPASVFNELLTAAGVPLPKQPGK